MTLATIALVVAGRGSGWPTLQAQPPTNPIAAENMLPGTPQSQWDISGSGDPSIQGFATDISVNRGTPVTFKIKLQPDVAQGFTIDVYRLGYYQGFGARKVDTVVPTAAQLLASQSQPACLRDDAAALIDCGNWNVSATFPTAGLTSGVYLARPRRTDTGGASHIVFIVRDDSRKADMLFQTSDTTWQAYNTYPGPGDRGASLYCNYAGVGGLSNAGGAYAEKCATRAAKVSYNRPFDTRDHDKLSWLFNGEYPMIRFLEANGYDVKYWTGVDTDRLGANPLVGLTSAVAPRVFLSVGHDEYWSGTQRTNVERARDGGINLAFFSGNEMLWKTRYEPSIDGSSTAHRTLVSYKETFSQDPTRRIDPDPAAPWTGTWRDTRFSPDLGGGRPENGLTGTIWTVNCCSDRLIIGSEFKNLRFWRNTGVASLPDGETYVMPNQTLGYEWDEDLDNGSRPAGLIRLSSTTLDVSQKAKDFGINVEPGTATHSLTLYRHNSGALVFGAGTVQWSYGLDSIHDELPSQPDRAMQQATINLFADMGAQPLTLQIGADTNRPLQLAAMSQDIFAPTSAVTSPANGASVPSGGSVNVTGTATENGGGAVAGVEISTDGATWHPALLSPTGAWSYHWQPGAVGSATIRTRAIDDSGNLESAGPGVTVAIVPGECPCTSLWKPSSVPTVPSAADSAAVEVGLKFFSDIDGFITGVRFYKGPANVGTHVGSLWTASGTRLASAVFANETATGWQQVQFTSPVEITANTTYVVSYHSNIGGYAADAAYLTTPVDSPPLHAPTSAASGGNGLFEYGESKFPTQSFNATNYWVDVVFSPTLEDERAPVISQVKTKLLDSSRVTITWTTDESATSKILYSTDPALLTSTSSLPPGTVTIEQTAFVAQHSVTLTGLASNTTYYYRVISVDRAGNAADVAAPTFTVPGPTLRDTSASDFQAGVASGSYVAETADGEVLLAPSAASEFSGTAISPGWLAVPWFTGGIATVGNGRLVVDGSRVGTCEPDATGACIETSTAMPGHRLDFVATFSGDAFQHAGFGQRLDAAPWAIFSTGDGGTLMARSVSSSGLVANDVIANGSSYLGAPHRYTIDWRADRVDFSIDGVLVKTHGFAVDGPMRPIAASDFSIFGGNIVVDWMRMSPYAAAGTFESRVFDAGSTVAWNTIQWNATTPAGTGVAIAVRVGDTPAPGAGWTAWQPIAAPGALNLNARYIQYQATLTTADADVSPSLEDLIITTGHAPVAVDDSIVVPENGVTTLPANGPGSLTQNDTDQDGDQLEVIAAGPASHGAVTVLFDGSVRYTPEVNYSGPDSFTYTVSDGLMTSSASVAIDVRFGNIPPVANADFYTLNEDSTLSVLPANGVLKNDTDVEHNTLTAELVSLPVRGTLTLNSIGGFTYTPNANYAGPDAFSYKVFDGEAFSDPASVSLNVLPVNDAPVSEPDSYIAVMNQTLLVPAKGVLANDHDVEVEDTAPLHTQLVSAPAHGTLTLNADGSFTYVPNADFLGADSFTYAAVDHFDAVGSTATVTLTTALKAVEQTVNGGGTVDTGSDVTPTDPLASSVTTPSAATISIAQGVIAASQPPSGYTFLNQQVNITILNQDGTELTASAANPIRMAFTIDGTMLLPGEDHTTIQMFRNGTLIPNCLGQATIPAANLDPCVTAREAVGGDVRLTILTSHASRWNMGLSSAALGDAPHAVSDGIYDVDYQTPLVLAAPGVLGNDYGRDGLTAELVAGSEQGGTVVLSPSGALLFMPGPGVCGPASFQYRASDGVNASEPATVSVRVDCTPVANGDEVTILEDSGANSITVLANDTDPDPGQVPFVSAVGTAAHGTVAILGAGIAVNYTPNASYFGDDSFVYTITDGRGGTATATVTVHVSAVNDAPSFVKGANQAVNEDAAAQSIAGWATGLSSGPANESAQALDFIVTTDAPSLFAVQPAVSSSGTLTYVPAANANGAATVTVQLHDDGGIADGGSDTSAAQTFTITVAAVNDVPSFVKGADQTVAEDAGAQAISGWATALSAGPADEASQTLAFSMTGNSNPSLFAVAPAVNAAGTLTYTPAANISGTATITLVLADNGGTANGGVDTSASQSFVITVTAVNDAPSFVKGADVTVLEDSGARAIAAWATGISAGQSDEAGQALSFTVSNGNNALFAVQPQISASGNLTFTPAVNANGVATVTVQLHDDGGLADGGSDTSAAQTFTITVTAVNDVPSFTKGADQTIAEDAGAQSIAGWATALSAGPANEAGQTLAFSVTGNSNPSLFAVAPAVNAAGTLTYTPAANVNGSATVTLRVADNGGTANGGVDTSASQSFVITVTAVNDAPSFVKGADQSLLEDAGAQSIAGWASAVSAGPANEAAQTLDFVVSSTNTALFAVQPQVAANGTLTFTPAANASGSAVVTVRLHDNGGTANGGADTSAPQAFTITVGAVNDIPAFVKGADVTVNEDAGAQSLAWATGISAGPNEASQVIDFNVSSNNTPLFVVQPSLTANGTLTFTPAANASGSATVTVRIHDDGGTANGGVDISAPQTFTITVASVNDAPSFVKGADQAVLVDFGPQSVAGWATSLSAGPTDESSQALNFLVSNDNTALFSAQPSISSAGSLTYTSAPGATGSATVTVRLHDDGGVANGGVDTSAAQTFTITVVPKPAVSIADTSVIEGDSGQTPAVFAVDLSGPSPATTIVSYQSFTGTAATPKDFITTSGTVTFAPGEVSKTVTVMVVGETMKEKDETFSVRLSNPVNATLGDASAIGIIDDDDATPHLNATSTSLKEGTDNSKTSTMTMMATTDSATTDSATADSTTTSPTTSLMTFAVAPTNANSEPMTVDYVTVADSTTTTREGIDYVPVTGTITFPAESTQPILVQVPVVADGRHERTQRVFLRLLNPVEAIVGAEGQGDIVDDDPVPSIDIADVTVGEASVGRVNAVLTVTLSNDSADPVTVNYSTLDGSAIGGKDFEAVSGVLTFQPGETSQVITLGVAPDTYAEGTESFTVLLSSPANGTLMKAQATVTITPPVAWVSSTAAEFASGSLENIAVADTGNGELTLSPAASAEFHTADLPAGWTSAVLAAGGSISVAASLATFDGASLASNTAYTAGRTLEFAAKFATTGVQQIGFGGADGLTPPLAMFVTKGDGVLYARSVVASGKAVETRLGPLAGTAHRFRIDWNGTSVVYGIDGARVASHAVALGAKTLALRPVIADQGVRDGAVMVDWIRMTPYADNGTFISRIYDAGVQVAWKTLWAAGDIPTGTKVVVDIRTGDTPTPDGTWEVFRSVTPGDSIASFARYAQYRVRLATSVPNDTPVVREIALAYEK